MKKKTDAKKKEEKRMKKLQRELKKVKEEFNARLSVISIRLKSLEDINHNAILAMVSQLSDAYFSERKTIPTKDSENWYERIKKIINKTSEKDEPSGKVTIKKL